MFEREDRYLVLKRKDISAFLTPAQHCRLTDFALKIRRFRGPQLMCVVVESDWPEYEPTWDAIQRRVEGRPTRESELLAEVERLAVNNELFQAQNELNAQVYTEVCEERDRYKAALEKIVEANWSGHCKDGYTVGHVAMEALAEAV